MLNHSRLILICVAILSLSQTTLAASVHDNYTSPRLTIPFATTPPTIDGIINDAEWSHALQINALQTTEANLSTRDTTFYLCWDADDIYIAMRSPLRRGERPVQAHRQPDRDNEKVVFDDAYEIFLNANTHSPDGEPVFFQYLGNVAGAKYDLMFEPAVGNSRPGWESHWKPKNRVTPDGKFWEMEIAIPRQSLYHDAPFIDGEVLSGLLVHDFKRPFEQNSLGGSGSFSAPDSHCKFVLSKDAPALHMQSVADATANTLGLNLVAASGSGGSSHNLKWSFTSDGGVTQSGALKIAGENATATTNNPDLDKPGEGYYRIRVTDADTGVVYLDWSSKRKFGDNSAAAQNLNDNGKEATLSLIFNPVYNFVRVTGDFINYDQRNQIARFTASITDSNNKILATQELTMDSLAYVNGLLKLGDCPSGSYTTALVGYDTAGKQVFEKQTPFEKKDLAKEYPWWHTTIGNIDRVIAPWTPVQTNASRVDVWGRMMNVDAAGLPNHIVTQGHELLANVAMLTGESNGQHIYMWRNELKNTFTTDYRSTIQTNGMLGNDIDVTSKVTTEFDGLYKIQLTLAPHQNTTTTLDNLKITVPLKPEFADYLHACGEGIRYGFSYGYLPKDKTGVLWDSKQVDGQPMLVGSFIPYLWIGNATGGLAWMADSDQGWAPNDQTPAIQVRRDSSDHVDLVLNLISSPTTIDQPRTITFAFQATPVKPFRPGWRMDTWSTGDSFQDFCQLYPRGKDLIWNAIPFTLDTAKCKAMVEHQHATSTGYLFGFDSPKYHLNAVPYFENNQIDPSLAPASAYFADQWHARVSDSLCIDPSLTDFLVYSLDNWCKQTGIDGWYIDNVRPVACDNIDAGRGYRLPDGRIQPTYQMFDTRIELLRIRAMFQDNGKSGKFVLHMTNHMIMPWIGAADLALDGEDHVTFPDMRKDFIDFWSLPRMRLDYAACQGTPVTFLQEYQGNWQSADLDRVMRAYTAMTILNDVLPGANPNGHNHEVWAGRERFGIDANDVTFVPYWDKDAGISTESNSIFASSWRKPGRVLIAIANTGEATTTTLHLDTSKLGVSDLAIEHAIDADTGEPLAPADTPGTLKVPINRHDYRQVLIGAPEH